MRLITKMRRRRRTIAPIQCDDEKQRCLQKGTFRRDTNHPRLEPWPAASCSACGHCAPLAHCWWSHCWRKQPLRGVHAWKISVVVAPLYPPPLPPPILHCRPSPAIHPDHPLLVPPTLRGDSSSQDLETPPPNHQESGSVPRSSSNTAAAAVPTKKERMGEAH